MKTVMLVDDERPARELLKMAIDWEKAGFQILFEARNGKQAFEYYCKHPTDLIITDIQMPVMDGLELLKQIKAVNPQQKIVILSCHESFTYARQALKYGAMDYLIKDALTEDTLFHLLENIHVQDSEKKRLQIQPPADILHRILSGREEAKKTAFEQFDLFLKKGFDFFCCICRLESFSGLLSEWNAITKELAKSLEETDGGSIYVCQQQYLIILCYLQHQNSKMNMFNSRFQSLRIIRQNLELLTGCSVSMGVSSQSRTGSNLYSLIEQAYQALETKVFQGTGKTLYFNPQYNRGQQFQIDNLNSQLQRIRNSVEALDEAALQKALSGIYNKNLAGVVHYNYLNYVNAILIDILMESCKKRSIPYKEVFESEVLDFDVFDKMNSAENIYHWFLNHFFKLFHCFEIDAAAYSPRVNKIMDYIQKNYQTDISLETIASTFWIHKVYLAKIFKQETGKSVNEYIRQIRIEKAKELLIKENIRISEIVTATGFNSPQSFYTIFKKHVGMSPGEYRELSSQKSTAP